MGKGIRGFLRGMRMIAVSCAIAACPPAAWGLINPTFTPVHLVSQSGTILTVRLKGKQIGDMVAFEVVAALKGKAPAGLTVDLAKAPKEHADAARRLLAARPDQPVLFFLAGKDGPKFGAFLHVRGTWLRLVADKEGAFALEAVDQEMASVWAGGTDMLTRCVQYALAEGGAASVPAEPGTQWRAVRKVGSVGGPAADIAAVDLAGDGKLCLFVASPQGDRLLKPGKGAWEDITAKVKLALASRLAAWGDFGGDGRGNLACLDAKGLMLWIQATDGTFAAVRPEGAATLPEGCVGMSAIAVGAARMAGLLISPAAGRPILLKPTGVGSFQSVVLPAPSGEGERKDRGKAQPCIAADFNGDSFLDVIQPFQKGGLIYLGNKEGGFDAAKPCAVCLGGAGGRAAVGDFDGDGVLDVLTAGEEGVRIFHGLGDGTFEEALAQSGEVAYKTQPGASWCGVCDFNNDGRQDLFITYRAGPILLYFNRGFRSFGQSPKLESALEEASEAAKGQQMGVFADFAGVGAQGLVLVMNDGGLWLAENDLGGDDALCVKVRLGKTSPTSGPLSVALWHRNRCLGAGVVYAGGPPAFFGLRDAGAYTLKWRLPGGKEMTRAFPVNKQVNVVLDEAR
jgi:hypothetical protein